MKKLFGLLLILFSCFNLQAQTLNAYQIYNKAGEKVSFAQMIDRLSEQEVILFGELHNNAIIHWLELRVEKALYQRVGNRLVIGAEMFERDNQQALNSYLSSDFNGEQLKDSARLWANFKTDYKPLLDFARDSGLTFIATNVPRRYARMVAHHGMDTLRELPKEDRFYIAEIPIKIDMKTPGYKEMKGIFKKHDMKDAEIMNFISAQAVKDATMAESILQHQKRKQLFLHFNGNYHSKAYGGIYWYLKKRKNWLENLKIAVITVTASTQKDLPLPKELVPTDFIIVVPADMTKTY